MGSRTATSARPRRSSLLATLLLPLVAGTVAPRAALADEYDDALAKHQKSLRYTSLGWRNNGWWSLAATKDPRAIPILLDRYEDPGLEPVQSRYLLAHALGAHFRKSAHGAAFQPALRRHAQPEDAWLWYEVGAPLAAAVGPPEALAAAAKAKDARLLAAAVESLGLLGTRPAQEAAFGVLDALPKDAADRGLLLSAVAGSALGHRARFLDRKTPLSQDFPGLVPGLHRLVDAMGEESTPEWARLALARQLSWLLGLTRPTRRAEALRQAIEARVLATAAPDDGYARPSFMGLEATGRRIAYVIDLSDSMLEPLKPEEIRDLRGPVVTGKPAGKDPSEEGIPWDRVRTRFDAARESLKLALRGLSKEQSFVVVVFGSRASLLPTTPGLRPATKAEVARTVREIDSIVPGSATPARPHGTLRGDTNLHGALRIAFSVTDQGPVKGEAYVVREAIAQGCDTLFVLSDGRPTQDDWPGSDPGMVGGRRDWEKGETAPSPSGRHLGTAEVRGPYSRPGAFLVEDVRRMNLFRKAEIHCVGIGEADAGLLDQLAAIGLGRARRVGGAAK